jgi:small subunit ribosomal protein S6
MYIVDPETAPDKIEKLNEAVGGLIEKEGGEVVKMELIGMKTMAYNINKREEGYYVLFEINGTGQEIMELERRMRVNDMIMRYITVRVDEDRKKAEKLTAKREARRAKRTSFRATGAETTTEAPAEA